MRWGERLQICGQTLEPPFASSMPREPTSPDATVGVGPFSRDGDPNA